MATIKQRARRANKLKARIGTLRASGYSVKELAECFQLPYKTFWSYASGSNSPQLDTTYEKLIGELDALIDKPTVEEHQLDMFTTNPNAESPGTSDELDVNVLVESILTLRKRNEELEAALSRVQQVLGA